MLARWMFSESPASLGLLRRCALLVNFEWPAVETGPKMLSGTLGCAGPFVDLRCKFSEQWK